MFANQPIANRRIVSIHTYTRHSNCLWILIRATILSLLFNSVRNQTFSNAIPKGFFWIDAICLFVVFNKLWIASIDRSMCEISIDVWFVDETRVYNSTCHFFRTHEIDSIFGCCEPKRTAVYIERNVSSEFQLKRLNNGIDVKALWNGWEIQAAFDVKIFSSNQLICR